MSVLARKKYRLFKRFLQKQLKNKSALKKILAAVVVLLTVALLALYSLLTLPKEADVKIDKNNIVYVQIKPGMGITEISNMLENKKVIDNKLIFWLAARFNGVEDQVKTGNYALSKSMDARDVLRIFVAGKTSVIRFTVPEGFSVRDIAKRLDDEGIMSENDFLAAAKDYAPYDYITKNKNEIYRVEGFLFPATYEIEPGIEPKALIRMMTAAFDERFTADMRAEAARRGMTIKEIITLASLVEKEARYADDRPIIAQVFWTRLDINMPLQSDTTIQYLLDAPKEEVSIKDTEMESPYNTYQHYGLPPGPIANPGMEAIEAVLSPADTDYLYFVADHDGHNHYAMTYSEHQENVRRVR